MGTWLQVVVLAIFWSMTAPVSAAEPCRWMETKGEAVLENVTPEEARQLALRKARADAVEKVVGVEIKAKTLVLEGRLAGDFIRAITQGYIVEEQDPKWEQEDIHKDPQKPSLTLYRVNLKSCVAVETEKRDSFFFVTAELNKDVFVSGEKATLKIRCGQDCYLSVLNLAANDLFHILLPDDYQDTALLKDREELIFPRPEFALEMVALPDHPRGAEAFLVVATKESFDFRTAIGKTEKISIPELSSALLTLSPSKRAEEILVYEMRSK